jgi:hypothetical protein
MSLVELGLARRGGAVEQLAVEIHALRVFNVSKPTESAQRSLLQLAIHGRGRRMVRVAAQLSPAALATVDVLKSMVPAIEEFEKSCSVGLSSQIGHERKPARTTDGGPEVVQDDLAALSIKVDRAASRQERKVRSDLVDNQAAPAVEDRAQPILEAEFASMLPDEVDHCEVAFAGRATKTAAELLGKDRR